MDDGVGLWPHTQRADNILRNLLISSMGKFFISLMFWLHSNNSQIGNLYWSPSQVVEASVLMLNLLLTASYNPVIHYHLYASESVLASCQALL